ncbi:MAG: hypothetical protein H6Q73_1044 [Firmicutes bacterium]|nr:hypothetical protein [Bacillota bacterium]
MLNNLINDIFIFVKEASLANLAWFSVIAYAIHYAEEGPGLVAWFTRKNNPMIFMGKKVTYTQKKLRTENALLFSITVLCVIFINKYPDNWFLQALILGQGIGFVTNSIYHAIPTLKEKVYSPGVVTASSLFPLALILYLYKAAQFELLTLPIVLTAFVMGNLLLPVAIVITHNVILKNNY